MPHRSVSLQYTFLYCTCVAISDCFTFIYCLNTCHSSSPVSHCSTTTCPACKTQQEQMHGAKVKWFWHNEAMCHLLDSMPPGGVHSVFFLPMSFQLVDNTVPLDSCRHRSPRHVSSDTWTSLHEVSHTGHFSISCPGMQRRCYQ